MLPLPLSTMYAVSLPTKAMLFGEDNLAFAPMPSMLPASAVVFPTSVDTSQVDQLMLRIHLFCASATNIVRRRAPSLLSCTATPLGLLNDTIELLAPSAYALVPFPTLISHDGVVHIEDTNILSASVCNHKESPSRRDRQAECTV
jgi:hypothetical protein